MSCCGGGGGSALPPTSNNKVWYTSGGETYTSVPAIDANYPGHRMTSRQVETDTGDKFKSSVVHAPSGEICKVSSKSSKGSFLSGLFNWKS